MKNWPAQNDRNIVRAMKENPHSPEWEKCRAFLTARIKWIFGGDCPDHLREDIVQETLIKVFRGLKTFSYQSPLVIWLGVLLTRTAIDYLFRKERKEKAHISLDALQDASGEGLEIAAESRALEDHCLTRITINELVNGYREWLKKTDPKNAERDFSIWSRCVLQGQSVKHIAACLNVSIHIIYRVLRKARKYFSQFRRQG